MEKDTGILGIWQSVEEEEAGIWRYFNIQWTERSWMKRMRQRTMECVSYSGMPEAGRRCRQSVFVIKGEFSMAKTDEHFLSDDS